MLWYIHAKKYTSHTWRYPPAPVMATLSPVRTWQMATLAAFSHLKNRVFAPFYGGYNGNLMRYGGDMCAHTEKDRHMNIYIYVCVCK